MTEAKGSDVRAALDKLTCRGCADGWPIDESFSRQRGKLTHVNPKDSFYIATHTSKADEIIALFEAHVQAAVKNVQERLELMHQGNMDVLMDNLKEANAREQAAAVEMRERCAAQAAQCAVEFSRSVLSLEGVKSTIRALPIPTDALDAMLLRARIAAIEECAKSVGSFPLSVDEENRGRLVNRLRALTQPAPEKEKKG